MLPQPKPARRWTYADYLTWPEGERWELIDGVAYAMAPAPTRRHQEVSWLLVGQIRDGLKGSHCKGFHAPFDVRLAPPDAADDRTETVVQPDLAIFCDPAKLDERGARGAPELVVEILSPTSAGRDTLVKRRLYETNGVPEYWIVDPVAQQLFVLRLQAGRYVEHGPFGAGDEVESEAVAGVRVTVAELFPADEATARP